MASKCTRSPNGKHNWNHGEEQDGLFMVQYKICVYCNRKEVLRRKMIGPRRWKLP